MASINWDKYAAFYDWENARTMGRRDLAFWKRFVRGRGRTLELGSGTGRLLIPLARTGARIVGVDYSSAMLERARLGLQRVRKSGRPKLVRGDIRELPFRDASFERVFAPYGVLQSLTSDEDFKATLRESRRLLKPGGRFGFELIPELKDWQAYQRQVVFRGKLRSANVTLRESVRQDRKRGLTIFDEEFTVRSGGVSKRHRFPLTFRTLPMESVLEQLARAGFSVESVAGSYGGKIWTPDAHVWIVLATR